MPRVNPLLKSHRPRYDDVVASHASDHPHPAVVELEPDQYSPAAFWAFVDEMLARPEPKLDSIGAAEALREIRADADPEE